MNLPAFALLAALSASTWQDRGEPPLVLAPELSQRADLVGREVQVEGRKPRFEFDKELGWNLFRFQGSPVRFRLPRQLSYKTPPNPESLLVRGVFRNERQGPVVDLLAKPEELPSELARLERGLAPVDPRDTRTRAAWAAWAAARARAYNDEPLARQASAIQLQILKIQASAPENSSPSRQLEIVREARRQGAPEPEPSALAHDALRRILLGVSTPTQAEAVIAQIKEFLPETALQPHEVDLAPLRDAIDKDPAAAYRAAEAETRAAIDRDLYAEAQARRFALLGEQDPAQALTLADEARGLLPDRPDVAASLQRIGLARTDVATLRLNEVQDRARQYRELGEPDLGRDLLKAWLVEQRSRLSPSDAEGRLALATQFESLAQDPATAGDLLQEAWKLDPRSESIATEFRRRGYRRVGDEWQPGTPDTRPDDNTPAPAIANPAALVEPYLGLTREEVLDRLGKPDSTARVSTQGQTREQWTYRRDGRTALFLHFYQRAGSDRAVVISSHN